MSIAWLWYAAGKEPPQIESLNTEVTRMLVLSRKELQQIRVGESIVLKVLSIRNGVVKIGVEAPEGVKILRGELEARKDAA